MSSPDKITPPEISLSTPKGGGAIRGLGESFESQDFSGTASFSIPIPAPPARGVALELNLSYSSGGGNGIFGTGFDLSLSNIARKTSNGIPRYQDSDTFILSNEGELAPSLIWDQQKKEWVREKRTEPPINPVWEVIAYRPRHENAFARIERWTRLETLESHWKVLARDNTSHWYGRSENSRIFDPEHPQNVFQWLLDGTQDPHGNKVEYVYKPENDQNLQPAIYEIGRDHRANRYISKILYGNYFALGEEHFAFQIAFDYGEFSLDNPDGPTGEWKLRPDPFSSYRSGFEIRTLRRCENILVYHCFHDRFGGLPVLTRALSLEYILASELSPSGQPAPNISFIKSVTEMGFRKTDDGSYQRKPLPPLTFKYSHFEPASQMFHQLQVMDGRAIPGPLTGGQYLTIDLKGEGLPGILYSDGVTTLQWEPQGGGRYSGPSSPKRFPIDSDLANPQLSITSIEGNGEPDLVVRSSARSGYYRFGDAGSWDAFQQFRSMPVDIDNPEAQMVDMDGDGRADLVLFTDELVKSYPSLGLSGYGTPDVNQQIPGFPGPANAGQKELLTFADPFGDGLSHRVRIRNGSVECWPNLGYGRFGPKVTMGNAPVFGGSFEVSRLFLVDTDGNGLADLVYVSEDHMQIFFNQSGNCFSDPVTIDLPASYDALSQISFSDINGNGTSCLILTRLSPVVNHYCYDFAGDVKPYLLTQIDNNLGLTTLIQYTTSVKQYLEDKHAGRTWATRLYFPVQVIKRVEYIDQISGTRHVVKHKYHDGYYDPRDREFRGFGYVETWDTEQYQELSRTAPASLHDRALDPNLYVPPTYTRSWFHTGASIGNGVISRQYEQEYWKGDEMALVLTESSFDPAIYQQHDGRLVEQAYAALAGQLLRQEVYGPDDSPVAANPYTINENSLFVRMIQPCSGRSSAVFFAYIRESLSYNYERNPADPSIQHDFTLAVDEFGNVCQKCKVAYPRRQNPGITLLPEQLVLRVVVDDESYINHPETTVEPYRWIGLNFDSKKFELEGLAASGYFSFSDLSSQVENALLDQLAYGQPFTPGQLQARLFSWNRTYYWNEPLNDALPLGKIASRGLLHHTESAALTPELVQSLFQGKLSPERVANEAGYWLDQDYWWNRGTIRHYCKTPEQFFLLCQIDGAFSGVDTETGINPTSTVTYDAYNLLPVQTTQYLIGMPSNPASQIMLEDVTLIVKADNDYQTLSPWRITDVNENISEVLYDPLGMVIASTMYGTEKGQPVGDEPLTEYEIQPDPTRHDVIYDPWRYLQKISNFFFYDVLAWKNHEAPACTVTLQRQNFVHNLDLDEVSLARINVTYTDGFGRVIESKLKTEPVLEVSHDTNIGANRDKGIQKQNSNSERWIVSGLTIYNNKGNPAEQYFPSFSSTPDYEGQRQMVQQAPPTVFHYDPLDRLIRTVTPQGFFSKVEFTAWEKKLFDEDDTARDVSFVPGRKPEKNTLDKVAPFYNTPTVEILDNLGRAIRTLQNNLGAVTMNDFDPIVIGSGITPRQLWDELLAERYLVLDKLDPTEAWVTQKLQPYDVSFQQSFKVQFGTLAAPILSFLKANGLTTLHELDIAGNEIRSTDPRLLYSNITQGTDYHNFIRFFDMSGNILTNKSADAGTNLSLQNIFGDEYWNWSARNFEQIITYDRLQRSTQVRVIAYKNDGSQVSDNIVEIFTYGELQSEPENCNLRGRLVILQDQSGILINKCYNIQGVVQETTRQFTVNYKDGINWAAQVPLDSHIFKTQFAYNEFHQLLSETTPDGSTTTYVYNQAGLLSQTAVTFKDGVKQPIVLQIQYNASGQRLFIAYANDVTTTYDYEPTTLRLLKLYTVRSNANARGEPRGNVLQDISYTYDPVGNVMEIYDASYQTVFNNNQMVEPLSKFTYDAIYRLLRADGRQHPGINAATYRNNAKDGDFKQSKYFPLPADTGALENYRECYTYDDAGNLLTTKHIASNSWTRINEIMPGSNQLKSVGAENGIVYSFPVTYDNSGNQKVLNINNPATLYWNCCENLVSARIIERPGQPDDSDFYTYDSDELRTRKISERMAQGGAIIEKESMLYVGNYQLKLVQKESKSAQSTILRRHTLRVMDDQSCVAIINYMVQDDLKRESAKSDMRTFRFQLDNHLGSVSMEVDEAAQLISYEEYFPYGGTALIAGWNQQEVDIKVYRYSGKECDDSTGLYYYGARYYASWLGRWLKPDPIGPADGLNLYAFVDGNPITFVDGDGLSKRSHQQMNDDSYDLGKRVAQEIKVNLGPTRKQLQDRSRSIRKIKRAAKIQLQKDDTVEQSVFSAMSGKMSAAKRQYRAANKATDEFVSTATVANMGSGMGSAAMSTSQAQVAVAGVQLMSEARVPTSQVGFNLKAGGVLQHPTASAGALYGSPGANHGSMDLARRDTVLSSGQAAAGGGAGTFQAMTLSSIEYTLNNVMAPPFASTVKTKPGIPLLKLQAAEIQRETMKEIYHELKGTSSTATQKKNAPWVPGATPPGSVSPRRV